MKKQLWYVNYLTVLFLFISGMKGLSGECVTFFSDRLIHDLSFTTAQYASLSTLFYLSYGISTIVLGMLTGQSKRRKVWLFPMTLGVGAFCVLTSMTTNYAGLAACRLAAGVFTGSSQAVMLSIISKNLVREDYGIRNGIISGGSSALSGILGPVALAALASRYAWNSAFLLIGTALIFLSLLVLFTVHEVTCEVAKPARSRGRQKVGSTLAALFSNRVFCLCFVIGLLETTANLCLSVFLPLYYSEVMEFDAVRKGWFLSLRGLCFTPIGIFVPFLADKFKIKHVMACTFLCAALAPGAAALFSGTSISAFVAAVFGSWAGVTVSLFTYMIPRKVLPEHLYMQGSGLILGVAVLFGGSAAPQLMSMLVDAGFRIETVLMISAVLFLICMVLSLMIGMEEPYRNRISN